MWGRGICMWSTHLTTLLLLYRDCARAHSIYTSSVCRPHAILRATIPANIHVNLSNTPILRVNCCSAVALQGRLSIAEDFPSLMSVDSQGSQEQRQRNEASMASSSKKSKSGGWKVARRDAHVCVTLQCESTMAETFCEQNQAATKQAPSISEASAGGKPLMKDAAALDVISDIVVSTTDESSTCSTCNTKRPRGSFSGNRLAGIEHTHTHIRTYAQRDKQETENERARVSERTKKRSNERAGARATAKASGRAIMRASSAQESMRECVCV